MRTLLALTSLLFAFTANATSVYINDSFSQALVKDKPVIFERNFTELNVNAKNVLFVRPIEVRGTRTIDHKWTAIGRKTSNTKEIKQKGVSMRFTEYDIFSSKADITTSKDTLTLLVKIAADPTLKKAVHFSWSSYGCEDPIDQIEGVVLDEQDVEYLIAWAKRGLPEEQYAWDLIQFRSDEVAGVEFSMSIVEAPAAEFDQHLDDDEYIDNDEGDWLRTIELESLVSNEALEYSNNVQCN